MVRWRCQVDQSLKRKGLTLEEIEEEEVYLNREIWKETLWDVSPPRDTGGGGLYAGVESGICCPPPLSRKRKRQPTAEEPGSRRKTRRSRRPPSERWGKGVGRPGPYPKPNKSWGPAWCTSGAWRGVGKRRGGGAGGRLFVGDSSPPGAYCRLQEEELGVGGGQKEKE